MFDGMSSLPPYHDVCLTIFVVILSALRMRLLGSDAMSPLPPPPPMEEWDQVFPHPLRLPAYSLGPRYNFFFKSLIVYLEQFNSTTFGNNRMKPSNRWISYILWIGPVFLPRFPLVIELLPPSVFRCHAIVSVSLSVCLR
jgi:hypothetical protein